mgnify:FL=1|tara:strand:+ start:140 stop:679 length:540 start_codon:yes stop_codon:yes gene_type:complete
MFIDKSHSKKDLVLLFSKLEIELDCKISKSELTKMIQVEIKNCKYNDNIKNFTELLDYLSKPTTKQRPSTQEKSEIMFKCKRLIKWGNTCYIFDEDTYLDNIQPHNDCIFIHKWGDLSSVRRACRFYNLSPYNINHINPIISDDVQEDMEKNRIIKQTVLPKLSVRYSTKENPIIVSFD